MIEVRNLWKSFGETVAVQDVSFDVRKGEVLGFLGPNAAGKTTTMRILTCYLSADRGEARVGGYDVFEESLEVRRRVGYLPESAPLYMDQGVVECLEFVSELRGIPGRERASRIRRMVEVCGLGDVMHKTIGQLSRGFRQRVGLALSLVHDPDILVLDEPTSGLDPNQIVEIRDLIRRIGREKTVILSTHILPEVQVTCDRVIIIDRGKLVASGTPEELASRQGGGTSIHVEIQGPQEEVESALRGLAGVTSVSWKAAKRADRHCYVLKASDGETLTEEVFRLAVRRNWVLSKLSAEKASLEEVFSALTSRE
ncbi:MAG: ATP-binding cassette domain-containing protein [Candidatus Eisenbacteria sp.]|nr:ATP-binding cassette domain-containing protein [Candidatus Eisenbacteria bacterium]